MPRRFEINSLSAPLEQLNISEDNAAAAPMTMTSTSGMSSPVEENTTTPPNAGLATQRHQSYLPSSSPSGANTPHPYTGDLPPQPYTGANPPSPTHGTLADEGQLANLPLRGAATTRQGDFASRSSLYDFTSFPSAAFSFDRTTAASIEANRANRAATNQFTSARTSATNFPSRRPNHRTGFDSDHSRPLKERSICEVCGSPAIRFDYNANVCLMCAMHFERTVSLDTLVCTNNNNCSLVKTFLMTCDLCWLKKCLKAGMKLKEKKSVKRNLNRRTTHRDRSRRSRRGSSEEYS